MGKMKTTACLKIVNGMPQDDQDALLERLDKYTATGVPPQVAQIMAATDMMAELQGERGQIMQLVKNSYPNLFEPAKPAPKFSARQQFGVNLSAATDSIDGLRGLQKRANEGDASATRLLNHIAYDALERLTSGLPSVKITRSNNTGLYGGELEPSLGLAVSFEPQDRAGALAALARFADNFNQQQVHVHQPTDRPAGTVFEDGSWVTVARTINLKQPLSRERVQGIIDESGLFGLTYNNQELSAYYIGGPEDEQAIGQFEQGFDRAVAAVGADGAGARRAAARLWVYGRGDVAGEPVIPYAAIDGDVRTGPALASLTALRVAEDLAGGPVSPAQMQDITPAQRELQEQISEAYEALPLNDLANPDVRRAYDELASEVLTQFQALPVKVEVLSGKGEPYANSEAMRADVLDRNHLFIFGTDAATFGPKGVVYEDHPLLRDSGLKDAKGKSLVFNDLLRAVHDYYAHTMSPVAFGPKGEEAAWKNHMGMTKSPWARWALTAETRGQNSWVNFREGADALSPLERGFAEQKVGLLPIRYAMGAGKSDASMRKLADEIGDGRARGSLAAGWKSERRTMQERLDAAAAAERPMYGTPIQGASVATAYHFSTEARERLSSAFYGKGLAGAERERLGGKRNDDIRNRIFFYIDKGDGVFPEGGVGPWAHSVELRNLYDATTDARELVKSNPGTNNWERAIKDAGFDGYLSMDPESQQGFAALLGKHDVPVKPLGMQAARPGIALRLDGVVAGVPAVRVAEPGAEAQKFSERTSMGLHSALARGVEGMDMRQSQAGGWKAALKGLVNKGLAKQEEIEWSGIDDWLDLQEGKITKDQVADYLRDNGVKVEEVVLGDAGSFKDSASALRYLAGVMDETEDGVREIYGYSNEDDYINLANDNASHNDKSGQRAKYARYTLPGGANYREVLLTLPERGRAEKEALHDEVDREYRSNGNSERYKELLVRLNNATAALKSAAYKSSHWSQANVLAHIRVNDRTDADGKSVLFVEELQSDWGQDGKKKGFDGPLNTEGWTAKPGGGDPASGPVWVVRNQRGTWVLGVPVENAATPQEAIRRAAMMGDANRGGGQTVVPAAPFVTKTEGWLNLALKRVITMAAEGGYDRVAFVTGEQSAERYDLSQQIDRIDYNKNEDGSYNLSAIKGGAEVISKEEISEAELEDLVGKDVAAKIVAGEGKDAGKADRWEAEGGEAPQFKSLSGLDLKVGGKGMQAFYDLIVPAAIKKLLPKVGGEKMVSVEVNGENKYDFAVESSGVGGTQVLRDRNTNQYLADEEKMTFAARPEDGRLFASIGTARRIADSWSNAPASTSQPGFDVTDAMREKVETGLPQFSEREDWSAPAMSKFDDIVYKMQNKHIDTKRVVEAIQKVGGELGNESNPYLQEELFHGRAAKQVSDFAQEELRPLMEQMQADGLGMAEVEEYLHARHAKEANRVIAERNPDAPGLQDGGSGMKDAVADAYMASLDEATRAKLERSAEKVDAIIAKTRQLYADYGLESQEKVSGWGEMFKHYIPLMREQDGENTHGMGIGQGFSVKGKEVKSRTGSARKVVDVLANIAMQREKLIVRGEKNRVSQALVGLAAANPNKEFWQVGAPPAERVYDAASNTVVERVDPMYKSRPNVVVAKLKDPDGSVREVAVVFNEDDARAMRMATALKNLDAAGLEGLLGVSAKITRYFASVNTQYNPVFGVVNLIRDVQGALVNLDATPLSSRKGRIARDTIAALSGIYADLRARRGGEQTDSEWARLWEEFQTEGGQTGFRDMFATSKDRADAMQKVLDPNSWMNSKLGRIFTANGALKVPMEQATKASGWLFDWLSDYNESMENGVRLATYKAALEQGMSKSEAASLAKNLTVNFNRKGQVGQQAGALYAFFNAAMQGTARMGQTLVTMDDGDPRTMRLSATGKKVVYGGMLLGALQALMLAAAGFGDDDPPEFVRERSLIIPTGGKSYVTIPMPLGLHVIPGLGRNLTEFALGGFKQPAKRTLKIVSMFADAFNPIGNAGMSIQTIAPTALDPLVALTENKDWTGKPIARVSSNKAIPGHTQFKDTASALSKGLAEAINGITGGNAYVAGAISPTPDQIDYLLDQVTGGVGRELAKLEQSALATVRGEELPTHKVPLFGRFYGNTESQASQGNAFYANLNRLNEIETEVKGLRKDGKGAEAMALMQASPEARLVNTANVIERQVQRLKREKHEMVAKGAPREAVKAKEAQITEAMTRLNRAVERAKERAS